MLLVKKCLIGLAILTGFEARAQLNIFDPFNDNSNGWPESKDGDYLMSIRDGYYEVKSKSNGYWEFTHQIDSGLSGHFRIEVGIERVGETSPGKACGIVWGNRGDSSRLAFLIYGDGSFVFQHLANGVSTLVIPPTKHAAIRKTGNNNLRVQRNMELNVYEFSVNEQIVATSVFVKPASSEFGLYADVAGTYHFDNFWFVEQGNYLDSYKPQPLSATKSCDGFLHFRNADWGYSFCVPEDWRVDVFGESSIHVWAVGLSREIAIRGEFSKLAFEDSFRLAAESDFKLFIDSMKGASRQKISPLVSLPTAPNGEAWYATATYVSSEARGSVTVIRCYVYNKKTKDFLLLQTILPSAEETLFMQYNWAMKFIVETLEWPGKE